MSYPVQATLSRDPTADTLQRRRAGRFILATNVLASPKLPLEESDPDSIQISTDEILSEYKAQQSTER